MPAGFTYILTNPYHTVLYVGVSSALAGRTAQHKEHFYKGAFTDKYNVTKLVYYEWYTTIKEAIAREKQLKGWTRAKKVALINTLNPAWRDLFDDVVGLSEPY